MKKTEAAGTERTMQDIISSLRAGLPAPLKTAGLSGETLALAEALNGLLESGREWALRERERLDLVRRAAGPGVLALEAGGSGGLSRMAWGTPSGEAAPEGFARELSLQNETLTALCSDFDSAFRINVATGTFEVDWITYRMRGSVAHTASPTNLYSEAIEAYIEKFVEEEDQDYLRTITTLEHVSSVLKNWKNMAVRYRVKDNPEGLRNFELFFSRPAGKTERDVIILGFRRVDEVVRREEAVKQEARQDLEETLEGARTGLWTIELEDGCPPRLYADNTMRMLLGVPKGISPEECYRRWYEGVDPDYIEMVQEYVEDVFRTGRSEVKYPWNHPELGRIYIRCGGVPDRRFDKPGRRLKGYHQDITETMLTRQRQEKALMEALVETRRANSAKTEFLSHMSHDIRTPINGILGMLSIADKNGDDPDKLRECRGKVRRSAEHLLSLVNDVLDISKLESGSVEFTAEPFSIYDVLNGCCDILRPQAEEGGVSYESDRSGVVHPNLVGSPLHLRQVLINVVGNAIKYTLPGGRVFIRTEELSSGEDTAWYRFTVEDTGVGMSREFLGHVFEPFTQEKNDARTVFRGTGLGMTITKSMVEQMGGTITAESELGAGSRFVITVPLQLGEAPVEKPPEKAADISGMRVLLAEDNELNREIAQYLLEHAGALVECVENGQEAVDRFAAAPAGWFDCILMDVMMPVMDGLEATRRIRAYPRSDATAVPIIAITANAFAEDACQAREAGMNEHLTKPLDEGKMLQTIARYRVS